MSIREGLNAPYGEAGRRERVEQSGRRGRLSSRSFWWTLRFGSSVETTFSRHSDQGTRCLGTATVVFGTGTTLSRPSHTGNAPDMHWRYLSSYFGNIKYR